MHILVYGDGGYPLLVFQTQNSKCGNYEDFGMIDTLADYIDGGRIQVFCVDSVDEDSWSNESGDKAWRAWYQESYYHYIIEEVLPFIHGENHSDRRPIATGCSMGATHAAIVCLRRPDLFEGMIALSGVYDARYFFGGWMNSTLYDNSPVDFIGGMPADHPYVALYNSRKYIFCVGQGAWEEEGIQTQRVLDAYFRDLLTREDITDITPYRSRFVYVVAFSGTLVNMKNNLEILEFEPNQIITFRKLAAAGITKDDLMAFCDEAADFVEDGAYFSIQSIKKNGFESELFDLGFSDWFYASLLTSDDRFSYAKAFGNIILYKGEERITIQSFEEQLIKEHGTIDVYDLMTEMEETYGCRIPDRLDVIYKVKGTDVYYDGFLDRLYANTGIFNRELDATEGI